MTEIGFYCGEDWVLVLSAQPTQIEYAATKLNRVDGKLHDTSITTSDQVEACLTIRIYRGNVQPDEDRTAIAHNLVFDARQVFEVRLPVKDNARSGTPDPSTNSETIGDRGE